MAAKQKEEKDKKTCPVSINLTREEKKLAIEKAKSQGFSALASWLRKIVLRSIRQPGRPKK